MIKIALFATLLIATTFCGDSDNWQYTQLDAGQVTKNSSSAYGAWTWGAAQTLAKSLNNTDYSANDFSATVSYAGHYTANGADYWKFNATWSNGKDAIVEACIVVRCDGKSYQLWQWKANTHWSSKTGNNGGVEVTVEESECTEKTVEESECTEETVEVSECTEKTVEESECTEKTAEVSECTEKTQQSTGNNGGVEVTVEASECTEKTVEESECTEKTVEASECTEKTVEESECTEKTQQSTGNNGGVEVTVEASECTEEGNESNKNE